MFAKRTARRRRHFLLDSNQNTKKKPKKFRNRFLNFFVQILFLRQILKLFKASVLISFVFVAIGVFVVFSIFSPYFDIKKISVIRDNPNIDVEAIESTLDEWYGKNLLFLDQDQLQTTLFENFPEFREVKLNEKWPSEIILNITVSPPLFTLMNQATADFSVISEDGVILSESPSEDLPVIKVVGYEKSFSAGEHFLTTEEIEKIILAQKLLVEDVGLPVKEVLILPIANELHLVTKNNTVLWIDLQSDIKDQMRRLRLAADRIRLYTHPLEHVDLRIPNQIFWKPL